MADTVEMQDIRGLDIDKTLKGFTLTEYIFKNDVTVSSMSGDSIRWYQETAADLTATTPSVVANVSPLSGFPTLEASWTRNTSYVRKYAAEGFLSMEDIKSADISILTRTLLRLTRAVAKQVDSRIWDVMTESRSVVNINTVATSAAWNTGSWTGVDIIEDILDARLQIDTYGYDSSKATLYLSPLDHKSLMVWLISSKGASIPQYSSEKVSSGTLTNFLGVKLKVSVNVTADYACLAIADAAVTWKEHTPLTAKQIEEPGIGTKVRVYELGEAILTDPKAVCLITNTQA